MRARARTSRNRVRVRCGVWSPIGDEVMVAMVPVLPGGGCDPGGAATGRPCDVPVSERPGPGISPVSGSLTAARGPVDSEGVDVGLLGPVHVDHGSRGLGPRDRVVLSALAVSPGSVLSADQLADALWRESPPDSWTKVVQGCVVRLRKVLGADAVETTPHGYRLVPGPAELSTPQQFERLVERGNEHLADGVPERAVDRLPRGSGPVAGAPVRGAPGLGRRAAGGRAAARAPPLLRRGAAGGAAGGGERARHRRRPDAGRGRAVAGATLGTARAGPVPRRATG